MPVADLSPVSRKGSILESLWKKIKKNKVLLQFENFAVDLDKYLWTDYVFVNDGKSAFFNQMITGNI